MGPTQHATANQPLPSSPPTPPLCLLDDLRQHHTPGAHLVLPPAPRHKLLTSTHTVVAASLLQALGAQAFSFVPLSFCIPEDLTAWQAWMTSPAGVAADTGLWMLKTGQDAGKGLRLVHTTQ